MTNREFIKKLQNYVDKFGEFCKENNIDTNSVNLDHICYKCESSEEYENIKKMLEYESKFVYQSIISKRRIAYIGFFEPLSSICGNVYYLELADQKPDNSQKSKCDHLEPIANGITYEEMLKRFSINNLDVKKNIKPHHSTYDIVLPNRVKIKLSYGKLIDKIYKDELILDK